MLDQLGHNHPSTVMMPPTGAATLPLGQTTPPIVSVTGRDTGKMIIGNVEAIKMMRRIVVGTFPRQSIQNPY